MIDRNAYVRNARSFLRVAEFFTYPPILLGWWWAICNSPPQPLLAGMFVFFFVSILFTAISITLTLVGIYREKRHDRGTDYADKT